MAKFRNDNLDLETGEHIDFDDADTIQMGYDGGELYINSTVSGIRAAQPHQMVRYDQLTETSGILQDQINDLEIDIENQNEFIELIDTPTTYSGQEGYHTVVNSSADGLIFTYPTIVSGTAPPASGTSGMWYNNNDNIIYYWDEGRDKWLSVYTHNYLFTYSGNIDGLYMSVGNVVNSYAHFHILRDATITALTADQDIASSQADKGYEIQVDGSSVFNFNVTLHEYINENLNVDIPEDGKLQAYVVALGARVRDPILNLELRWRYSV